MKNYWAVIMLVIVAAVALIIFLFKRNQIDKKHLLNKFTKTGEEGKIDSNI